MNDFEEDSVALARENSPLFGEAHQPEVPVDAFVRRPPNLANEPANLRLLEDDSEGTQERPRILRSAMKGGRRKFLADAEERTKAIAADHLLEQGKQRDPRAKELKKARKQMFDQVRGGKDALNQAAVPRERRQFNRVAFAPQGRAMDFDFTDAPSEISAQKESDKNVWGQLRGGAVASNRLFENEAPVNTEERQQDTARKRNFASAEQSA